MSRVWELPTPHQIEENIVKFPYFSEVSKKESGDFRIPKLLDLRMVKWINPTQASSFESGGVTIKSCGVCQPGDWWRSLLELFHVIFERNNCKSSSKKRSKIAQRLFLLAFQVLIFPLTKRDPRPHLKGRFALAGVPFCLARTCKAPNL